MVARKSTAEGVIRDIRRKTRKRYGSGEKIRIVLDGLRGEDSIAELCRREGIARTFVAAGRRSSLRRGKKRLSGDTAREAGTEEVKGLRRQAGDLKEVVAELMLENRLLEKSMTGYGDDEG